MFSRYWCCVDYRQETMEHLFLTSSIATQLWKLFADFAGIGMHRAQLNYLLKIWWFKESPTKLQ